MKIILKIGEFHFGEGNKVPSADVLRDNSTFPLTKHFLLAPGRHDYSTLNGKDVLINADEYCIGFRRYPVGQGYSIEAILTDKGTLVPKLRKAVDKERRIELDSNREPANKWWPIIRRS